MAYKDATTLAGTIVADMTVPPGEAADVAWIKNGEPAEQTKTNRPHQALAENCDFLRAAINRDLGLPTVGALTAFSGNSIDIDPSGGVAGDINYTGTLYLGESGWTGQERLDQLFQLLDENYQEVSVGGVEAKITSVSLNALGDGFVSTLTTLNLNVTIPSGNYRIGYYEGTDLENIPPYAFTHAGLRGLEEVGGELKEHKGRLEIAELTAFSGNTVDLDPTAVGGGDYDLSPAGYVYLGGSSYTGGGAEEAGFLFQILDEDYNPVVVDGTMVLVSSTSPVLGSGFYNGGVVTLTLNATLPSANYRLLLARNDNVSELADDALVKGMTRYSHRHPTYEAFTAVLTDGTNSTGGDYSGINAIDNLASLGRGGRVMLKRGNYEWNATADLENPDLTVVGELLQWGASATSDVTSIVLPSGGSDDFSIQGRYENIFFSSEDSTWSHVFLGKTRLTNVNISPGSFIIGGNIQWRGGTIQNSLSGAAVSLSEGARFSGLSEGIVEDVYFVPPPSGAQTAAVFIYSSSNSRTLTFKNCTFDSNGVAGCHALILGSTSAKILFEGCTFIGSSRGYCVYSNTYDSADQPIVTFSKCHFSNDYGFLLYSKKKLVFEDCQFETGSSNPSYSITAVNTTTETFTVTGDHSHLSASDRFYVYGSTANDGYYTVVSTSGTGPTDITVSEDVTDATADGIIVYAEATAEHIFALGAGAIRNCSMTVSTGNIGPYNIAIDYAKISIGRVDGAIAPGDVSVDGLYIDGLFTSSWRGSFVLLCGGSVGKGQFNNIHLSGLPPAVSIRGSGEQDKAAWLEIIGDTTDQVKYCNCKNISVLTESASAGATINDDGCIVVAYGAHIDGIAVDAADAGFSSASVGAVRGALYFAYCTVKGLTYCPTNGFACDGSAIMTVFYSTLVGCNLYKLGGTNGAATTLFDVNDYTVIRDAYCSGIEDWINGLWLLNDSASNQVSFTNNYMRFVSGAANNNATLLIELGANARIVGNSIMIKRQTVASFTAGDNSIVDSNILDYLGGGATPGAPSVGTGGVVGDNVLVA